MGTFIQKNKGGDLEPRLQKPAVRSAVMFVNFFLIIMALYQLKPASRSLILDAISADYLPYIWIGSAVVLFVSIVMYERLLDRFGRFQMVLGTATVFILILVLFWLGFNGASPALAIAFYIFVDLFGVVLVEQFWSLANSVYATHEGKSWYGLVGTGGLMGGAVGSAAAAMLIKSTPLQTIDLLLVGAAIVFLILLLTWWLGKQEIFERASIKSGTSSQKRGWRHLFRSRYLLLIAAVLLMVQLVSPMIEFQFMHVIEDRYTEREARTEALSFFFSILSAFAVTVNLLVTPLLLRKFGVLAGLLVQPVMMLISTFGFMLNPGLWSASIMKISDRGLSYSINRASKELLYIPVDPDVMYQVKGWIDMFGYRTFKIFGALIIIALAQMTYIVIDLNWIIMLGCAIWVGLLVVLHRDYLAIMQHKQSVF
ncbi:MAG: MFS transporter [Proteobacteria bacterium]|nr:MFS transporter [Pseudomonadota bacterium]